MADCSCYHNDINFIGERGVCWGTKEKEPCRCGGDETKCDFYPKRAAIVLSKDKAFEFKLDGETSQVQVIKDMKKYGLAVMRPKTNADLVRQMSDEELARYYAKRIVRCYGCEAVTEDDCFECQMYWLKAPVEEVDNGT